MNRKQRIGREILNKKSASELSEMIRSELEQEAHKLLGARRANRLYDLGRHSVKCTVSLLAILRQTQTATKLCASVPAAPVYTLLCST